MPDGKVILSVCKIHGQPVEEEVGFFMKKQTLSHTPTLSNLEVSRPVTVTGLKIFPNGTHSLAVDKLSYHTVSQFIRIPPNGDGVTITIILPEEARHGTPSGRCDRI